MRKSNFYNEDTNPCVEESKLSQKCMESNAYVEKKCTLYFDNYNRCKKFWHSLAAARRVAGIKPFLPTKVERDKIMEQRRKGIEVISVPLE